MQPAMFDLEKEWTVALLYLSTNSFLSPAFHDYKSQRW